MSCQKALKWIALFVSGDLDPKDEGLLQDHLQECKQCQKLEKEYRQDRERILSLKGLSLSERVFENFWEGVEARLGDGRSHTSKITILNWGTRLALAASLLIAVTLWGGKMWEGLFGSYKSSPSTPLSSGISTIPTTKSVVPASAGNRPFLGQSNPAFPEFPFLKISPKFFNGGHPVFVPSRIPRKEGSLTFEMKEGDIKIRIILPQKEKKGKPNEREMEF